MKLGVFVTRVFEHLTFEDMLEFVKSLGIEAVEFGTGNYPGDLYAKPSELLMDEGKRTAFQRMIESRGLIISALSAHGNPLHPNEKIARQHHETLIQTIDLAQQLGVKVVVSFSGTPGTPDGSQFPNFPISPWPPEYLEIFEWQWEQKIIPYWKEVGRYAAQRGIRIGIEPYAGFSVHSPATLLKLRQAVGEVIGVSLDFANLWWQGIDPVEAVKILGYAGSIYHVSTKDISFSYNNTNLYGILDMQPRNQVHTRSWLWRTIGYGHDLKTWADIISALQLVGYNYAFNIEHEDPLIDGLEGIAKAAGNLRELLLKLPPSTLR